MADVILNIILYGCIISFTENTLNNEISRLLCITS